MSVGSLLGRQGGREARRACQPLPPSPAAPRQLACAAPASVASRSCTCSRYSTVSCATRNSFARSEKGSARGSSASKSPPATASSMPSSASRSVSRATAATSSARSARQSISARGARKRKGAAVAGGGGLKSGADAAPLPGTFSWPPGGIGGRQLGAARGVLAAEEKGWRSATRNRNGLFQGVARSRYAM